MAKIKFDVSASDPDKAVRGGLSPKPGLYVGKVAEINEKNSRGDDGQPDPDRPMLEVVYEVVDADKKPNKKFVGSRLWSYLMLPGHPSYEQTVWKMDQFVQAIGLASKRKRKGTLDTDAILDTLVEMNVRAGTNQNGDYRGEIASVLPYDEETFGQASDDDEEDEEYDEEEIDELEEEEVDEDEEEEEPDEDEEDEDEEDEEEEDEDEDEDLEEEDEDEDLEDEDEDEEEEDEEEEPPPPPTRRKSRAKKSTAKKTTARKSTAKKSTAKRGGRGRGRKDADGFPFDGK